MLKIKRDDEVIVIAGKDKGKRGKVQRDKSEMKSALNAAKGSAKLEDQMVSMEAEMKALRNMVASLEKELAAAKRRPPQ